MTDVKLSILLDAKQKTDAAFASVRNNMQSLAGTVNVLKGALAGLAAGVGIGAVVSGINSVTSAASDMRETVSKVNTLFGGEQGAALSRWADGAAVSMGLAKQEALDAVGSMGNMFLQLGAGADEAAKVSTSMIKLSSDITSFQNVSGGATQVIESMQSAFRGEYDSLQRYIPTINAAAVEHKALAETGKSTAKELTNIEKAMATYALVMEGAGAAVGDFGRTSGDLAGQQRILDAQMKDLRANIGESLIPAYTDVISKTNAWIGANKDLVAQRVDGFVDTTTASLKRMVDVFNAIPSEITTAAGYGIVGRVVFGGWGPAKIVGGLVLINETLEHFNSNIGSIGESWRELGKITDEALAELDKRLKRAVPSTLLSSHGSTGLLQSAHGGDAANVPAVAPLKKMTLDEGLTDAFGELDAYEVRFRKTWENQRAAADKIRAEQQKLWDDLHEMEVKALSEYDDSLVQGMADTEAALKEMRQVARDNAITFELDTWFGDLDQAEDKLRETSSAMIDLSQHTAELMQDNLSSLFLDTWRGELDDFSDYFKRVFESLQKIVADALAQMATEWMANSVKSGAGGIGGFLSGLFGGAVGGAGGAPANLPEYQLPLEFHKGGVVGYSAAPVRAVPRAVFAGAPRLHDGLAYDEFPAILQRGERVIPKGAGMSGGGVTINMSPTFSINAIDTQTGGEFLRRNGAGVAAALVNEMKHSYELSRLLKAT